MAKTEFIVLEGKLSWVRTTTPNKFGKWCGTLHPIPAALDRIQEMKAMGLKNDLKKDDDGYNMTFNRPTSKEFRGKLQAMQPPMVFERDGKTPFTGLIGNGTDGAIKVEFYHYNHPLGGKGCAARLFSIRVDNLVPYEPRRDADEDQEKFARGLEGSTTPLF